MRRLRDARGMTLVELMVVLLVFSLVSAAVFSLLFTSLKAYWKGDLATQVQQGGRLGLDRLTRDVRQARRLLASTGAGGFTFATSCSPNPQISFVLPHLKSVSLADGSTIYATDPNPTTGAIPYDGWYVSYYLSAAQGSTTPDATGPYLERTVYDLTAQSLTTQSIASNVTALAFSSGGACPTASTREVTITLTASQTATGQNVSSTDVVKSDVALRNQ
jgi:prepilin-type N-terminal cleavage/methylation domain-containing protein